MPDADAEAVGIALDRIIAIVDDPARAGGQLVGNLTVEAHHIEREWREASLPASRLKKRLQILSSKLAAYDRDTLGTRFQSAGKKGRDAGPILSKSAAVGQMLKTIERLIKAADKRSSQPETTKDRD